MNPTREQLLELVKEMREALVLTTTYLDVLERGTACSMKSNEGCVHCILAADVDTVWQALARYRDVMEGERDG